MTAFDLATDSLFTDQNLAIDALLRLGGTGPAQLIRVIRTMPDQFASFGEGRFVVDTVLLASALWLCWLLREYPFADSWLSAKVLGLLVYIGLGTIALKRGRTPRVRAAAFVAALAAFGYIVWVALTRDARGPLALLGGA